MKKKNFLKLWLLTAVLFTASNAWAQVPAHKSINVQNAELWTLDFPPASAESVAGPATFDYKVVTIGGKAWVWMKVNGGNFWGDATSFVGFTTDEGLTATGKYGLNPDPNNANRNAAVGGAGNTELTGSVDIGAIPEGAKIFTRPQINVSGGWNGAQHTKPVVYPAAGADATPPTFANDPEKELTTTSITISLNATDDSGNLFYYIVDEKGAAQVIFKESVTYTFSAVDNDHTYTIYAVDFSGNASEPKTVETINKSATKLPAPTGLALSADKKNLTFNAVAGAAGYLVIVLDESNNVVFEQENFNTGDALKYFLAGNLTVNLQAVGDGVSNINSDNATIAWGVTNSELDLTLTAEYDGSILFDPTGNNGNATTDADAAYFSWETNELGHVVVTIKAHFLVNGTEDQTVFRALLNLGDLTVNGYAGNNYFTAEYALAQKQWVLKPIAGKTIPYGSEIMYRGYMLYRTVANAATNTAVRPALEEAGLVEGLSLHDLYPNASYTAPFIYGTVKPAVTPVLTKIVLSLTNPERGTAFAVNQEIGITAAYTDQNGFPMETPTDLVWTGSTVTGSGSSYSITPTSKGAVTLTVSSGAISSNALNLSIITDAPNVALGKTVTAIEGSIGADFIVNGNFGGPTWEVAHPGNTVYDAWVVIDLGTKHKIEFIEVVWEGAYSKEFTVDYSDTDATSGFTTKYTGSNTGATNTKHNKFYENPSEAQYVRIFSTEAGSGYGIKMHEVAIYGTSTDTGTNLSSTSKATFSFYPNPATDVINFGSAAKEVKIYSLQGQLVLSQVNVSNVNVSGLTKGMYIIQAMDNAGKQSSAKVEVK